jgi:uncharacterized protein
MNMKINAIINYTLAGLVVLTAATAAQAQIDYTGSALNYTANFDSLGTTGPTMPWANNSTLPGWYLHASSSSFGSSGTPTNLDVPSIGGESSDAAYNIGTNGVQPVTTRALGWVVSSATGTAYIGLQLQNISGNAFLGDITLNYTIGQFSAKNTLSETVTTGYKLLTSTGSQLGSAGFTTLETIPNPNLSDSGGGIDGFAPGNFTTEQDTIDLSATPWNNDEYLWFQVTIPRASSGNNELLAIEGMNVSIDAVPEPATPMLIGLGILGLVVLRRRHSL